MCAIAGIYRRRRAQPDDGRTIEAMASLMAHRGPDDHGYLLLDPRDNTRQSGHGPFRVQPAALCLASRRLAILDLTEAGRQPMSNPAGDVTIVYNGEIFNYVELRRELASLGHRFRSQTDTEIVLHSYLEWGADCVTRFNGMWAFAIWDQRSAELFCSRDRFGIKPFYYFLDAEQYVFASEIKAILPALATRPGADYTAIAEYLSHESLCTNERTFFEHVRRLPAGHNMVISAAAERTWHYWTPASTSHSYDETRPVETFRELLTDAISIRLRSDVGLGVALSGGIDSSTLLAGAAKQNSGHAPKSFNITFPGDRFDESRFARIAAAGCGSELHTTQYQPEDLPGDLRRVIWHLDYPALFAQVLPRWRLMEAASRQVRVIFEGQGADELLAGYPWRYFTTYLSGQRANGAGPGALLADCRRFQSLHGWRMFYAALGQAVVTRLPHPVTSRLRPWRRVYDAGFAALAASPDPRPTAEPARGPMFGHRLNRALANDLTNDMLPGLLKFGDAISMAHSVESRVPFLDHRLVEFGLRLPVAYKFDGAESKSVLRSAASGLVPEPILARRDKVGFMTPTGRWLRPWLESAIRPTLLSARARSRGIYDTARLDRMLTPANLQNPFVAGSIFRWYSTELWFETFID